MPRRVSSSVHVFYSGSALSSNPGWGRRTARRGLWSRSSRGSRAGRGAAAGPGGAPPEGATGGGDGRGGRPPRLRGDDAARAGEPRRRLQEHLLPALREQAGLLPRDLRRDLRPGLAPRRRGLRPARRVPPAAGGRAGAVHAAGRRRTAGGVPCRGRIADPGHRRGVPSRKGLGHLRADRPAELQGRSARGRGLPRHGAGDHRRHQRGRLPPPADRAQRGAAGAGRDAGRLGTELPAPGRRGGPPRRRRGRATGGAPGRGRR